MIYGLDKINQMADGGRDYVNSVISVFLEEVPMDLEGLEKTIKHKDYDTVYKLPHKIKPNVDLLGMEHARSTALEIETSEKNEADITKIEERFPLLKKDVLQVISEPKKDFNT